MVEGDYKVKRVLIVDDEAAITDGLVALFEMEGIEAVGAYDLHSAVERLESESFSMVLADVRLRTEEEGLELLESVRRVSPTSRVASLTAFATEELEETLRSLGSSVVLRKPMEFEAIVAIVAEILAEIEATAAQGGVDAASLETIYSDLNRMLLTIPQRKYGLSAEEAEDLVQEAWLIFIQKQREIENVKPWFAGTMVNLSRQRIDRVVRGREREEAIDETLLEETFGTEARVEDPLAVQQALAQMDERGRVLCTLIGMEGWSYDEVSAELDIPLGSVGPLYIRAKKRLRALLEPVN